MAVFIFVSGIIIGSFLNVCVHRIPKQESIIFPRSYCPKCEIPLKWYNLIPILSFLLQRGRCKYCGKRISLRYPIVELLNGIIYLIIFLHYGLSLNFIFYAYLFSLFGIIIFIDLENLLIPNILVLLVLLGSIIFSILNLLFYNSTLNLINSLMGLGVGLLIFLIIFFASKGEIGGGDVKLIGVLGFILGIPRIILSILLSFLIGGIVSIILLCFKIKGRKDCIPFAPSLILGFIITLFWGDRIINWYIINFLF
ncbi:prepilin peptidase [Tepidimicrobium xylanilyticum]|uniref:Leader peptidase (Prepilin peptidase) / N-methyltransferase n=1 Tax=Tepidimicrobium xylanilyticum TaxID=1123352 RepID=A0A1H3CNI6_9FIRM|nr:A24 family peptidase [Tepidimicrobium xylanilyticum]GMG97694.1 type 4 prepilin-like proteins leader peptide-processing enzyme [Tepidimicrobium xylanilyticum]SDX55676.1 leader peptidase (prepilin peptidase) / N-methyltransferase [Tepidimicrobium xylanilyticum]